MLNPHPYGYQPPSCYWPTPPYYTGQGYPYRKPAAPGNGCHLFLDSNGCLNLSLNSIKHFNFAPFIEAHIANLIQAKHISRAAYSEPLYHAKKQPETSGLAKDPKLCSFPRSPKASCTTYDISKLESDISTQLQAGSHPNANSCSPNSQLSSSLSRKDSQNLAVSHSESTEKSGDEMDDSEVSGDYLGTSHLVKRVGSSSFELLKEDFTHSEMRVIRKSFKYSGFPMKTKQSNKKLGYYENHCLKCPAKLIVKKNKVNTGLLISHQHQPPGSGIPLG